MQSEQSAITQALTQLAALLGPLSPFTKAVVPSTLGVADIAVNLIFTGGLDATDAAGAAGALIAALIAYFLPNKPKAIPVVPAPVIPAKGKAK